MSTYPWNPPYASGSDALDDLDTTTPIGATDPVADVDDAIRQIKSYLKDATVGPEAKIEALTTLLSFALTPGTTAQYLRGDQSWQTLDKAAVGLGSVDNTSDVNKPISNATQAALNTKEPTIAAGTTADYWRGDKTWQPISGLNTLSGVAFGYSNYIGDPADGWAGSTSLPAGTWLIFIFTHIEIDGGATDDNKFPLRGAVVESKTGVLDLKATYLSTWNTSFTFVHAFGIKIG